MLALGGCGSRTGLFIERGVLDSEADADVFAPDPALVNPPSQIPADGDAGMKSGEKDSGAPPPIDPWLPDAAATCLPGTAAGAYLVASGGAFYAFDPSNRSSVRLGTISCPVPSGASPFTMTLSGRDAFILFSDGSLVRVDVQTLVCTPTLFVTGQLGFPGAVGLGTERVQDRERLLVYGAIRDEANQLITAFARAELDDFVLSGLTRLNPKPRLGFPADVKVDAYGRVFIIDGAGTLVSVDNTTGTVLGRDETGLAAGPANALLTWNDEIYVFTQAQGLLHRYDIAAKSAVALGAIGDEIVGASAAPCLH